MTNAIAIAVDVVAKPAGQRIPCMAKRPGDARPYIIDCHELLRPHELLMGQPMTEAPGLVLGAARTRQGRYLEIHLAGGQVAAEKPHTDYPLRATAHTTGGTIEICIDVRVHAR